MKYPFVIPDIHRQQTTIKEDYVFIRMFDCVYRHLSNEQHVRIRYSQNAKKGHKKKKERLNVSKHFFPKDNAEKKTYLRHLIKIKNAVCQFL